jgi:hypothetical protein
VNGSAKWRNDERANANRSGSARKVSELMST